MKLDINETMKQIMGYKEKLGEFSLDLYYDDVSQKVPYVAKLHSADYSAFKHYERADCFDTALARTDIFLQDLMLQGKRISDLVPQVIRQRPRGTTSSISLNESMRKSMEKWPEMEEKFQELVKKSGKPILDTLQHELFSDEEYAKKEFECHGYKFHPKPFVCNRCGAVNDAKFVWVEGNRSIQERCSCCDSYITCVKYDPRDKGDKISDPFYKP